MHTRTLIRSLAAALALSALGAAQAAPLPDACALLKSAEVEALMDRPLRLQGGKPMQYGTGEYITVMSNCGINNADAPQRAVPPVSLVVNDREASAPQERDAEWLEEHGRRMTNGNTLEPIDLGPEQGLYFELGQSQSLYILLRGGQSDAQISARPAFMSKEQLIELGTRLAKAAAD